MRRFELAVILLSLIFVVSCGGSTSTKKPPEDPKLPPPDTDDPPKQKPLFDEVELTKIEPSNAESMGAIYDDGGNFYLEQLPEGTTDYGAVDKSVFMIKIDDLFAHKPKKVYNKDNLYQQLDVAGKISKTVFETGAVTPYSISGGRYISSLAEDTDTCNAGTKCHFNYGVMSLDLGDDISDFTNVRLFAKEEAVQHDFENFDYKFKYLGLAVAALRKTSNTDEHRVRVYSRLPVEIIVDYMGEETSKVELVGRVTIDPAKKDITGSTHSTTVEADDHDTKAPIAFSNFTKNSDLESGLTLNFAGLQKVTTYVDGDNGSNTDSLILNHFSLTQVSINDADYSDSTTSAMVFLGSVVEEIFGVIRVDNFAVNAVDSFDLFVSLGSKR